MPNPSTRPQDTDLRLRSWLDANQQDRERMCQALLSLDPRFRDVRPRMPQGGADGGRDLEAVLDDGREVWVAVGFRNSASDSRADVNSIKRKFHADLTAARTAKPDLSAFIFMTNVRLTVTAIAELTQAARDAGLSFCEVFHRERLRILLDSPDGLGFRFQYLQLSLSEAEQATFFARWGTQLHGLITQSFSAVDAQLARLEFLHECQRPLRSIGIHCELATRTTLAELGHFRVLMSVWAPGLHPAYSQLIVGTRNGSLRADDEGRRDDTVAHGFWVAKLDRPEPGEENDAEASGDTLHRSIIPYSTGSSLADRPLHLLGASGGFSEFTSGIVPTPTLGDLDENFVSIFVTRPLVPLLRKLTVFANGYTLVSDSVDAMTVHERTDGSFDNLWPAALSPDDAKIPWVRLDSMHGATQLHFSGITPHKRWRATVVRND